MPSTIPERLRAVRKAEGLALRPFAAHLDAHGFPISAATVGGYENGRTDKVPSDYVAAICRVFAVGPAWLLSGDGPMRPHSEHEAVARLEAIRAALEAPLPEAPPESAAPKTYPGSADVRRGADLLIELVAAIADLLPNGGKGRRDDAVRLVDHVATRLADARVLEPSEHEVWRTYFSGAAPGSGATSPQAVLAEFLDSDEQIGSDLPHLLYALGERLYETTAYRLAGDCHGLAFLASERVGDLGSACHSAARRALCLRLQTEWADALEWYHRSMEMAESREDWPRFGEALGGLAALRFDRGAMADVQQIGDRLVVLGEKREVPECVAHGHFFLSLVANTAGRLDEAIVHGWKSVTTHPRKDRRLRALFQTGSCLLEVGHVDAAEDAFRLAAAGIKDLSTRLLALADLAFVAAVRGDGEEYDRRSRRLEGHAKDLLSHRDEAQIGIGQAKAHAILGRLDEARRRFQDTLLFAETHGLNREAIQAEEALALLRAGTNPWPAPKRIAAEGGVLEVVAGLREMVATSL